MADPNRPELSGRISDGEHVLPLRVYFEDTDFSEFSNDLTSYARNARVMVEFCYTRCYTTEAI